MVKAMKSTCGMGEAIITKAWIADSNLKYKPREWDSKPGGVVKAITHDPNVTLTIHYYLLGIMNFDAETIVGMSIKAAKAHVWKLYDNHQQLTKLISGDVPHETISS